MEGMDDLFDEDLKLDEFSDGDLIEKNEFVEDIFESQKSDEPIIAEGLVNELLKLRGIDASKIKILDEDDTEKEVKFSDLTIEEQLEILNSTEEDDLDDSEIEFINNLRTNGLTVNEFLDDYKRQILSELEESVDPTYEIDSYTDQELYLLDLKMKYDLTDEELVKELEKEIQDEILFKKKTDKLRAEYKQLEDERKHQDQIELQQKQAQKYDQFVDQMVTIAEKTSDFYGLQLEDNEKNEVLSFLLDLDDKGISTFAKTINDPNKLYEAAWFLKYGKDAFETLTNIYESEIKQLKKQIPQKPNVIVRKDK